MAIRHVQAHAENGPKWGVLPTLDWYVAVLGKIGSSDQSENLASIRSRVAELIEADHEYEAARRDWDNATYGNPEDLEDEVWKRVSSRFENAVMRRLTALNNVGGAA